MRTAKVLEARIRNPCFEQAPLCRGQRVCQLSQSSFKPPSSFSIDTFSVLHKQAANVIPELQACTPPLLLSFALFARPGGLYAAL